MDNFNHDLNVIDIPLLDNNKNNENSNFFNNFKYILNGGTKNRKYNSSKNIKSKNRKYIKSKNKKSKNRKHIKYKKI